MTHSAQTANSLWGILLAAGASTRMGSVKALLPIDGVPAVRKLCQRYLSVCIEVVLVTGHHAKDVEQAVDGLSGVRCVRNQEPDRGQLSSLQTGLSTLPSQASWFLFAPVDCFGVDHEVLQPLAHASNTSDQSTQLIVPEHNGRRGHPVMARRELAAEFLALSGEATARTVIQAHRRDTLCVPIPSGRFLTDIDTPADYEAFIEDPANRESDSIETGQALPPC